MDMRESYTDWRVTSPREPECERVPQVRSAYCEAHGQGQHGEEPTPEEHGVDPAVGELVVEHADEHERAGTSDRDLRPAEAVVAKPRDRRSDGRDGREQHQPLVHVALRAQRE